MLSVEKKYLSKKKAVPCRVGRVDAATGTKIFFDVTISLKLYNVKGYFFPKKVGTQIPNNFMRTGSDQAIREGLRAKNAYWQMDQNI